VSWINVSLYCFLGVLIYYDSYDPSEKAPAPDSKEVRAASLSPSTKSLPSVYFRKLNSRRG